MSKRGKVTLGVLLIAAAIVYLMVTAFGSSNMYYLTIDEVGSKGSEIYNRPVRLSGNIDQSTIQFDITKPLLVFNMVGDKGGKVVVHYEGVRPDNMSQATQAIVEGKLNPDGTFVANKLMLSCPSKYEGKKATP
ncbi:MAG: cytochrome c maturation protein CcmE [Symbiobacteriia bacterium]